jgi:hypothetical protein
VCGAGGLTGCGGSGGATAGGSSSTVQGAGQGVGVRLQQEGLQQCVDGVATAGDPSPATGNPDPVTLSVYGDPGFGAIVATGTGAQDHAINLVVIRNHVAGNRTAAEEAQVESSWLRHARKALRTSDVPSGSCRSAAKLPVLSASEVVCSDQVLIPLGHKAAMDRFVGLLQSLLNVQVTPQQQIYLGQGGWLTIPGSTNVTRPYCHG